MFSKVSISNIKMSVVTAVALLAREAQDLEEYQFCFSSVSGTKQSELRFVLGQEPNRSNPLHAAAESTVAQLKFCFYVPGICFFQVRRAVDPSSEESGLPEHVETRDRVV